jgi:alkanesulfonate monooxygenase SsuD/methylene tetrahydromethanopterin reductase-like flavin-dependent oxidoreductase (luciferase family)
MTDLIVGLGITTSAARGDDPLGEARAAEKLGFDFVSASDHPVGAHPSYDTLTLLTWIAAQTSRIRVATRVLGVPFRRPAMLAKAAESLHRLSGGRLILGLGGGHSDEEIAALGAASLTPGHKVTGLSDAVTILRGAWSGAEFSHHGTQHSVNRLTLTPAPESPIPVWLGTYGPKALAVTGRLADGWIPSLGFAPPDTIPAMLGRIRDAAAAANRPDDAVRPVYNVPVVLGRHDDGAVSGSPGDVVEQLRGFVELGFRGFNLVLDPSDAQAVAEEVLPALRAT